MRELDELAGRFWAWRARQQPRTRDDIPRLDRPAGWLPETGPALADRRRTELGAFQAELARIRPGLVADRVDHRLLRSAMARVVWESDILRVRGLPRFWIDQAIGPSSTPCCAPAWTRPGSPRWCACSAPSPPPCRTRRRP